MVSAFFVRRDADRNAWLRLLRATRLIKNFMRERFEARFFVTLPHFDVLAALYRHSEGMLMSEIFRFLVVPNGNVRGIIDRPVADGLVVRDQGDAVPSSCGERRP